MFEPKTQINTLECEISEEDLMIVIGGANDEKAEVDINTFGPDVTISAGLDDNIFPIHLSY